MHWRSMWSSTNGSPEFFEHRNKIVEINMRRVETVAKSNYFKYGNLFPISSLLDFYQEAYIALMRAVERYDPTREVKFYSFMWTCCRTRVLRLCDKEIDLRNNQSLGKRPTVHQCQHLGCDRIEDLDRGGAKRFAKSPVDEINGKMVLEVLIAELDGNHKVVIEKKYIGEMTDKEIAACWNRSVKLTKSAKARRGLCEIGCSEAFAGQKHREALAILRKITKGLEDEYIV